MFHSLLLCLQLPGVWLMKPPFLLMFSFPFVHGTVVRYCGLALLLLVSVLLCHCSALPLPALVVFSHHQVTLTEFHLGWI